MNVLVLAGDVPATNRMPGSPRLFNLCKGLARQHRLTLAAFVSSAAREENFRSDPANVGIFAEIHSLPSAPPSPWLGKQYHRLRQEAHFITRYRNGAFHADICNAVSTLARECRADIVFVDGLQTAQYVIDARLDIPAAIDLHDSITLLYSRKLEMERDRLARIRLRSEIRSIARWERSLSRRFGAIITNSPVDEMFVKRLDPSACTLTIANGIDSDYFKAKSACGDMNRIVFTGVMNYAPNEDAAVFFAEQIMPAVRARSPESRFQIVGKDPGERVHGLTQLPGVEVIGEVPDVRPYLEAAGIFVCPLRWGAGVKNKLLAALSMGKATVATQRSLDGLKLVPGEHLLVADDPAEFASAVNRLIEQPEFAERLAQAGRAFVTATYSWSASAVLLETTLRRVASAPRADLSTPTPTR